MEAILVEQGEDPKNFTRRIERNISEQKRLGTEIPENMVYAYIINGSANKYDTRLLGIEGLHSPWNSDVR